MSHSRSFRRAGVVAATLALAGASLVACGSDTGGGETIRIGKAVDTIGYSAIDIAAQQGFFEDAGLDVEIVTLNGSTVANGALESGDIQFAGYSSLPLLAAREQGAQIISVASFDYGVPMQIIAGGSYAESVDPSSSIDDRLAALKGAKIGYVSSTDSGYLDLLLEDAGLPDDEIEKVQFNSAQAAITAAEDGQIDGAIGSPPATVAALEGGELTTIASLREVESYAETTYDLLNTTASYAEENPETVTAVATAVAKANDFINDEANADVVLDFEADKFSGFSKESLKASLDLVTFSEGGLQTQEQWDNALATYKAGGLIDEADVSEGTAWTNEYIDVDAQG